MPRRLAPLALCLLLVCAAPVGAGLGAQHGPAPELRPAPSPKSPSPISPAPKTLAPPGKAAKAPKAKAPKARAAAEPAVSREELLAPYGAMQRRFVGPPRELAGAAPPEQEGVQSNATSWKLDTSLSARPRDEDSPVQFKLGREKVVDPVTGKEISRQADPMGAANSLKELDVKGAADKLGGRAGIHVDVLKF